MPHPQLIFAISLQIWKFYIIFLYLGAAPSTCLGYLSQLQQFHRPNLLHKLLFVLAFVIQIVFPESPMPKFFLTFRTDSNSLCKTKSHEEFGTQQHHIGCRYLCTVSDFMVLKCWWTVLYSSWIQ